MEPIFKGYATRFVDEAVVAYREKTGNEPTVILVRPDADIVGEHSKLVYSPYGAAGIILITHLIDQVEVEARDDAWELKNSAKASEIETKQTEKSLFDSDLSMKRPIIPKRSPGRPPSTEETSVCPHCHGLIDDFNALGWWWGWAAGIEPPYWEDLRIYVFRRDGFQCQRCKRTFGMSGLICHHDVPKEDGGSDSARNLTTMCMECHPDHKPIFTDDEENSINS